MKKTISLLIICLLAIMSLTACGRTNTGELDELRQQVEELETRISELEKSEDRVEVPDPTKETTCSPTETTESNKNSNQQDAQVEQDIPTSWLKIAQCDSSTESTLLAVAKECATLDYYNTKWEDEEKQIEIAEALSKNSSTTDAVMRELVNARYPELWKIVASSNKSRENALLAVAKKCTTLDYYNAKWEDEEKQVEIADALSKNRSTTDNVMRELVNARYPELWVIVASSNKSRENTLIEVAKKCATLDYYNTAWEDEEKQIEIAKALSKNSATTDAVMKELLASSCPDAVSIAKQWLD